MQKLLTINECDIVKFMQKLLTINENKWWVHDQYLGSLVGKILGQ